jgi:hypothetical protein
MHRTFAIPRTPARPTLIQFSCAAAAREEDHTKETRRFRRLEGCCCRVRLFLIETAEKDGAMVPLRAYGVHLLDR